MTVSSVIAGDKENIVRETDYLLFALTEKGVKTNRYEVLSKHTEIESGVLPRHVLLGWIKWYAKWHQYVFYPDNETIYNYKCLDQIAAFIDNLMNQRSKKSK